LSKKYKQKVELTKNCPECGSEHFIKDYSRAEVICNDCGLVVDQDLIDHGPEWRAFDSEQHEKRARTGAPMTYTIHDKGLSTAIGWTNKDAYGRRIPSKNRAQIYRIRKWQRRIVISDATQRNLAIALSGIDRLASGMKLPRTVRETAAMIYRKAALKNLVRGRSIDGVIAASLYAACRQCHVPRTLDEVSKIANMPKKEVGRNYRFVSHELELRLMPTSPMDYIPRFCSELKLSNDVQSKTVEILGITSSQGLASGRGPTGLAAACLYIASVLCKEYVTQREIAETAGVTEVTIRNRYKEIAQKLNIEVVK
jgi:transcription initiation factor TFIIB